MPPVIPPNTVVYGMQLPVQAQSRLFAETWEAAAGVDELAAIARKADERGFFYVGVCDHTAIPRARAGVMGTTWYDTMTTLGFLAGITERVRLLTHVYVLALRHPLQAAKAFATLDAVSRGRAIFGVGAGHLADEFALLGADFAARGARTDEAIEVVKAALSEEFPVQEGPSYPVRDVGIAPRPVQRPRPPIWVGGSTRPALRRAAVRGDGWLPQGTPRAQMPEQIAYLLEHRRRALGDEPIDIGTITEFLHVGVPAWDVGDRCLSGPPERIAESLREFAAMGVNHLQVRFRCRSLGELLDQMDAFTSEVAPLLNR